MKAIPQYNFHKTKYGDELLIDVVELRSIEKYIRRNPIHRLTYYDITLITEGNGEFIINDYSYPVHPNNIVCSIPGEVRGWNEDRTLNGYALIFEEEFLLSFFNDPHFLQRLPYLDPERSSFVLHATPELSVRIHQLFREIKTEINNYSKKDHHILRAMLYEVLMLLNRADTVSEPQPASKNKAVNRHAHAFTQLVNAEFISQRNTKYYADKLCITANYLNEITQNILGVSAKIYIQNKVMQEAKRLLSYTTLSITEIADKLHYNTPSYFIRSFHKHTGLTPTQYRDSQNHEK